MKKLTNLELSFTAFAARSLAANPNKEVMDCIEKYAPPGDRIKAVVEAFKKISSYEDLREGVNFYSKCDDSFLQDVALCVLWAIDSREESLKAKGRIE